MITLGLSNIPAPAQRPRSEPSLVGVGTTGTPIFGGFLQDPGEYNSKFQGGPFSAFRVYEEMRRADAQVAATLSAIKLPIRGARWDVVPPKAPSTVELEATAFVKRVLLEEIDFDAAIENALLMLDFGCAAHEDVWRIDGGRVRLEKLAPRLPHTFYRWLTTPGGDELLGLVQTGWKGGQYATVEVPATKLAVFVHQQEGANFAGRALLRAMYKHWYIKSNLYKVDAIATERNGMGVPTITMGPDAKKEDKTTAMGWLQKLVAHNKAALLLPPDWKFELKGVSGKVRDSWDSILHHNLQISLAGLTMFMSLSQAQHGSHSLGATLQDFFLLSLQATADQIARTITRTTIRRLVDFNFGEGRSPRLTAGRVIGVKFEKVVAALKDLAGARLVQPDVDTEAWLRRQMCAPAAKADTVASGRGERGLRTVRLSRARVGPVNVKSGADCGETPGGSKGGACSPKGTEQSVGLQLAPPVIRGIGCCTGMTLD